MVYQPLKKIDAKEVELPETRFIHDIEPRVFQSIVLACLAEIKGVEAVEGTIIDTLLGRQLADGQAGIHVEQEEESHSVTVRVEVNVAYGVSLPAKAEEIQIKISKVIAEHTGLRVSAVHVIFKNLISSKSE